MITTSQNPSLTRRLNPFAFPANTTTRFFLLIVAVVCASLFISDALYFTFPANREAIGLVLSHCEASAMQHLSTSSDALTITTTIGQCIAQQNRQEAFWDLLGVLLLFSVAILFYWIWPLLKIWRLRLQPFPVDNEVMGSMQGFLLSLCREIGLSHLPLFLISTSATSIVTFGRRSHHIIALPARSVVQFQSDLPLFRAIMLHELSHIYNADVDKTYFSLAVVWAFVWVALLPWALAQVLTPGGFSRLFFEEAGIVLALTTIISLTLRALLRAREVYADVRASAWDGPEGALNRGIASLQASKTSLFRRLLDVHPDRQERIDLLKDTSRLFRIQPGQLFITGLIISSGLLTLVWMIGLSSIGMGGQNNLASESAGVFFAVIVAGTLGVDLWRATFLKEVQKQRLPRLLTMTGSLTLGLLVGQLLSPLTLTTGVGYFTDAGYLKQATSISWEGWGMLLLIWSTLLFLFLLSSFRWIIRTSAQWLEIAAGSSSPRRITLITLSLSCVMLGIWAGEFNFFRGVIDLIVAQRDIQTGQELLVGPLYSWYQTLQNSGSLPGPLQISVLALFAILSRFLINPFILVLFLWVWALPLTSWFWRKRATALDNSMWAYLDKSFQTSSSIPASASSFRLPLIFLVSLAGSIIFYVLVPVLFKIFSWHSLDNHIVLAVFFQAGIAGIVASLAPRLRMAHGLCAAFFAGCMMALVLLVWNQWYHSLDLTALATFLWTVNGGALVAIPVVAIVAALAG